ncbi:MAG: alpha-L-fucosidase [Phycisphaerales bacterium]|nr:MAG: alpha-L-fucosidase [Phycisphaerales bacterium]
MKKIGKFIAIVSLALGVSVPVGIGQPYEPTWQSLSKHEVPEWFRDAKFGIYTHWGPVTIGAEDGPGGVQWYGRNMYLEKSPTFKYHRAKYGDQNRVGYKDMVKMFKAEKFDAEQWAELFAAAGAKFAGPVAIHHDNYAMWDSKYTIWDSMDQSPKRDFTAELERSIRKRGMKFIATFHHAFAWQVRGEFSCAGGPSGLKITLTGQSVSAKIPRTRGWFRPEFVNFGRVTIDKAGVYQVTLEPADAKHWRAVNVYKLQFAPAQ